MAIENFGRIYRLVKANVPVTVELNIDTKFTGDHEHGFDTIAEIPGTDPNLKDQVVMVGGNPVFDPMLEAAHLFLGRGTQVLVAAELVAEPQHSSPETVGPFDILNDRVLTVARSRCGKLLREARQHGFHACQRRRDGGIDVLPHRQLPALWRSGRGAFHER